MTRVPELSRFCVLTHAGEALNRGHPARTSPIHAALGQRKCSASNQTSPIHLREQGQDVVEGSCQQASSNHDPEEVCPVEELFKKGHLIPIDPEWQLEEQASWQVKHVCVLVWILCGCVGVCSCVVFPVPPEWQLEEQGAMAGQACVVRVPHHASAFAPAKAVSTPLV